MEVLPDAVAASSFHAEGTWDNFSVAWDAVTNVNHGVVTYDIVLDTPRGQVSWIPPRAQISWTLPGSGKLDTPGSTITA